MKDKRKEFADGKIVVVDFKKIEPSIFYPVHTLTKEEMFEHPLLCTPDGRWFLNSKNVLCDYVLSVMEILVQESRHTLEGYRTTYKAQFKDLTFDTWVNMPGDDSIKNIAFSWLMIPGEIKRRELENAYYHKQKIVRVR